MNLKKFTQKDRFGNMLSYEFEANVPEMNDIPPAFQPGPKGTDTVPAWLTPGENVINAEASRLPGVQPMLDKLNEKGRSIQEEQGGSIPSYAQEGEFVSKITPEILDALRLVESSGDPTQVSPVGASGPYQIMEATAKNPGFGVSPIALEDRFDEGKSRAFADAYLKGIERANPNFTLDQILQSYHSGVGNVKKGNLGPEGQAYVPKINAAMNKEMPLVTYDATPLEPGMMSAMASTGDADKKDSGSFLDSLERGFYNIKKVPSMIGEKITEYGDKIENFEKKEENFYKIYDTKNEIKQIDLDINEFKKDLESANDYNKPKIEAKIKELEKRKIDLSSELRKAGETFDKLPDMGGATIGKPDDFSLFGKNEDGSNKSASKFVDDTIGVKEEISKKVAKDIISITGDDPSGGDLVSELYKQDQDTIYNKGIALGKEALKAVGGWFEETFKDMFSGKELARMAIMYAGSRALGYNHNASLNYSAKSYIDRVDSALAQRKKDATSKIFIDNFTTESIQKYIESGDMNDLISKGTGAPIKMSGKGYLRGYGQVTLFDNKDGVQLAQIGGQYLPVSSLPIEQWDDKTHGDIAVQGRFNEIEKNFLSDLNEGKDKDDDEFVPKELVGAIANKRYREILRQNGVSLNEAPQTEIAIQEGIKDYYRAIKEWKKSGAKEGKPQSVVPFINQRIFTPLTGIPQSLIAGASVANLNKLSNMVRSDMDNKNPQSEAYRDEFKKSWEGVLTAFRLLPKAEQQKYIRQGADTEGHTAFTLFFQDKGIDGIEAILKG